MHNISRRALLRGGIGLLGGAALTACAQNRTATSSPAFIGPTSDQVRAAEQARRAGAVRDFTLVAAESQVDLGGLTTRTWPTAAASPAAPSA